MSQICRHLLASGRRCTQPAVRTGTPTACPERSEGACPERSEGDRSSSVGWSLYCRHHQVVKASLAQITPRPDPYGWDRKPLPLVPCEDRAAIHLNYSIVLAALNAGHIDIKTANCFNRLLRSCEINLSHGPLFDPKTQPVQQVELTPEGEEIAPPLESASTDNTINAEDDEDKGPAAYAYALCDRISREHEARQLAKTQQQEVSHQNTPIQIPRQSEPGTDNWEQTTVNS